MKTAQNDLLKGKNAITVVEGELAHYRSLLARVQQKLQQKSTQSKNHQTTINDDPKEKSNGTDIISDKSECFIASVEQRQTLVDAINKKSTVNIPNKTIVADVTINTDNNTSDCTDSSPLLSSSFKVAKEAKIKPGQKIANVVKKLSQDRVAHPPNNPSNSEEVATHTEDKNTRKSLDAVVAKLHVVQKQELDKQFHVDLWSAKQVRENSKLDSVVEKLIAKQIHSQFFPPSYPIQFQTLVNENTAVVDSSHQCMEADVSSTVPDGNKFQSTSTRSVVKPVTVDGMDDSRVTHQTNVKSVVNTVTKHADITKAQTKLVSGPKDISKTKTAGMVTRAKTKEREQADDKNRVSNPSCLPREMPSVVPVTPATTTTSYCDIILDTVNKNMLEKFSVQPKDLEGLMKQDDSKHITADLTSESLTELISENSQVHAQQDTPAVPDAVFTEMLQVLFQYLSTAKLWIYYTL